VVTPAVSVVIPTHNRAHAIGEAIGSALAQTFREFEVLVVDDGSTDDTETVVRAFHDSRLRYIRMDKNSGASAARNRGVAEAKGEYVAFLDSDDRWHPSKLRSQIGVFRRAPASVGHVCTGLRQVTREGTVMLIWIPQHRGHVFPRSLVDDVHGTPSTMLVRRRVLNEIGGWDEKLATSEDWDLGVRISMVCKVDFVPEVLVDLVVDGADRLSVNLEARRKGVLALWHKRRDLVRSQPRSIRAQYYRNEAVTAWHLCLPRATIEFMLRSVCNEPTFAFEFGWRATKGLARLIPTRQPFV
jgi:glycosyltransferase involved in cell wall biosynthesis